jgi:hypothetical protein
LAGTGCANAVKENTAGLFCWLVTFVSKGTSGEFLGEPEMIFLFFYSIFSFYLNFNVAFLSYDWSTVL